MTWRTYPVMQAIAAMATTVFGRILSGRHMLSATHSYISTQPSSPLRNNHNIKHGLRPAALGNRHDHFIFIITAIIIIIFMIIIIVGHRTPAYYIAYY